MSIPASKVGVTLSHDLASSLGIHMASLPHILLVEKAQNPIQFQGEETKNPSLNWRRVKVTLQSEPVGWEILLTPPVNNSTSHTSFTFSFSPNSYLIDLSSMLPVFLH